MSEDVTKSNAFNFVQAILKNSHDEFKEIIVEDNELKSIVYGSKINLHQIKENRICSYKYCRNRAVMSHLFQESILRKISKNGHLLFPAYDLKKEQIKLQKIGVSKALLFPGYCQKHENIFSYEKKEHIEYQDELQKLLYKTICYHNVYWEELYAKMEKSVEVWLSKRHQKFTHSNSEKYQFFFQVIGISFKTFKFSDSQHQSLLKLLKQLKRNILEAKKYKKLIWSDILSKKEVNLKTFTIELDKVLPLCLSYLGELTMKKENKIFKETVCFIIHPYRTTTNLIFSVRADKYDALVDILEDADDDKVWEIILSSLAFVSDNWLINEDFYDDLPTSLKELIENARSLPLTK